VRTIGELIAWAAGAGVVWFGWLAFEAFFWPYRTCRRCGGRGTFTSPSGRAFRRCRRCKGKGERVRLGRRAWTKAGIAKKNVVG